MFWKLLGLQKKLDALFDDGWVSLGLPVGLRHSGAMPLTYPGE